MDGERCMEELMAGGAHFSAVLCANDCLAMGAITALRRRGLVCPDDMSVSGFNDMPMVDRIDPPLTTIHIKQYKVGFVAAKLLIERMSQPKAPHRPSHILMPVELVVRRSTCPPRAMKRAQRLPRARPAAILA
jgi:LacI family transcriptional regulator